MSFHQVLKQYVNGGCLSTADIWRSLFSPDAPFASNAGTVCIRFSHIGTRKGGIPETLRWEPYKDHNSRLQDLRTGLLPIKDELVSVIIHGSYGSGDQVPYSDIDALVIIRNEVFSVPERLARVASVLSKARRHMYRIDPIQHHGWFVLTEQDLSRYPDFVLPVSAIRKGYCLLGAEELQISMMKDAEDHFLSNFRNHTERLENKLSAGWRPRNLYQLKSLLSEFMMIPVLYQQAREGNGVDKKESFVRVRKDFSDDVWKIMDDVSDIRAKWNYPVKGLAAKVMTGTSGFHGLLRKRWPIAIPPDLKRLLDEGFYDRMLQFVHKLSRSVQNS